MEVFILPAGCPKNHRHSPCRCFFLSSTVEAGSDEKRGGVWALKILWVTSAERVAFESSLCKLHGSFCLTFHKGKSWEHPSNAKGWIRVSVRLTDPLKKGIESLVF